jgi:hypothetical protein
MKLDLLLSVRMKNGFCPYEITHLSDLNENICHHSSASGSGSGSGSGVGAGSGS